MVVAAPTAGASAASRALLGDEAKDAQAASTGSRQARAVASLTAHAFPTAGEQTSEDEGAAGTPSGGDASDRGPAGRRRSKGTATKAPPLSAAELAAAAEARAAAAAEAAEAAAAAASAVRERAAQLSAQLPLSSAFSGLPLTAMVRLSGSGGAPSWAMRWLAVPAGASVGQLRAVVAEGLAAQQLGVAAPAAVADLCAGVRLAMLNPLDPAADAAALGGEAAADAAERRGGGTGLPLHDSATVRQAGGGCAPGHRAPQTPSCRPCLPATCASRPVRPWLRPPTGPCWRRWRTLLRT